jgi:UDP-glucose 4-epimerase
VTTCLVTGGGGFIGSHLVERLLADGHRVRVLDDFSTGNRANLAAVMDRIELVEGSITDPLRVRTAVDECEIVYHLAALPSVVQSIADPLTMHEICATGSLRVLLAARDAGVRRVVYAGSASAYGDQPGDVRRETDLLLPLSPYAAAKLAGEHYCTCVTEVYKLETTRLRFFNVFGPRQDPASPYTGVIAIFLKAMAEGRVPTIYGDGLQSRDFVYVANVVQALVKAGTAPKAVGGVYNVGMGTSVTLLDLVAALNQLLGSATVPRHAEQRLGDVRNSRSDITAARRDLEYEPDVPFVRGLRLTLEGTPGLVRK